MKNCKFQQFHELLKKNRSSLRFCGFPHSHAHFFALSEGEISERSSIYTIKNVRLSISTLSQLAGSKFLQDTHWSGGRLRQNYRHREWWGKYWLTFHSDWKIQSFCCTISKRMCVCVFFLTHNDMHRWYAYVYFCVIRLDNQLSYTVDYDLVSSSLLRPVTLMCICLFVYPTTHTPISHRKQYLLI